VTALKAQIKQVQGDLDLLQRELSLENDRFYSNPDYATIRRENDTRRTEAAGQRQAAGTRSLEGPSGGIAAGAKRHCEHSAKTIVLGDSGNRLPSLSRLPALINPMNPQADELIDTQVFHATRLQAADEVRRHSMNTHGDQLIGRRMSVSPASEAGR